MTPAVVTETIWGLVVQRNVPLARVIILTTVAGQARMEDDVRKSCTNMGAHYPKAPIPVGEQITFRTVKLDDIRTDGENSQVANWILMQVSEICADDSVTVHASIAGGRKTMGYFLAAAMQFFGRPQDRLYHVLVDPTFESIPQFRYPGPRKGRLRVNDRNGIEHDTHNARVTLAEIPFISLRGFIHDIDGVASKLGFNALTDRARADLNDEYLDVHVIFCQRGGNRTELVFGSLEKGNKLRIKFRGAACIELIAYSYLLFLQVRGGAFKPHERDLLGKHLRELEGILLKAIDAGRSSEEFRENALGKTLAICQDKVEQGEVDEALFHLYSAVCPRLSGIKKKIGRTFRAHPVHDGTRYTHDVKTERGVFQIRIPRDKIHFWRRGDGGKLEELKLEE